jgi:hypothetical protein
MKRQQQERKERSRWAQEASKKNIYKVIGLITIKEPFFCLFSSSIHYKLVGSRSSRSFLSFLGCPNSLGYFCFLNTVKQKSQRLGSLVNSTLERYSQCAYSLLRMKKKIVIITGSPLSSLSIYIFFSGFCCFVYSAPASNGSTGSYIKARHRVYYCHKTKKAHADANRTQDCRRIVAANKLFLWLFIFPTFRLLPTCVCFVYVLVSWLSRLGRVVPVFSSSNISHRPSNVSSSFGREKNLTKEETRIFISS